MCDHLRIGVFDVLRNCVRGLSQSAKVRNDRAGAFSIWHFHSDLAAAEKFEGKLTKKRVRIIFAIFCGILLVEQIFLVRYINYNYEMVDPKITGEFAKSFVMGDDLSKVKESYRIYAAKYPNAWGMIYLQIPFYAVWKLLQAV